MFTDEQKKFINDVILPGLVNMAVNDNLPSDMNELNCSHFEDMEKAKKWYDSLDEEQKKKVINEIVTFGTLDGYLDWNEMYQKNWQKIEDFIQK